MKTPKGFNLKKAKIRPDGRLVVSYNTNESTFDPETPKHAVHDDLREAFQVLKYALIASHKLNWPDTDFHEDLFTSASESGAFKSLRKHLAKCKAEIEDSVTVTGFSSFGDEGTAGCVVTGKLTVRERTTAINTPRLMYSGEAFGFEEKLGLDIDNAINEVRLYLFEGKQGAAPKDNPDQIEMELEEVAEEADVRSLRPRKQSSK